MCKIQTPRLPSMRLALATVSASLLMSLAGCGGGGGGGTAGSSIQYTGSTSAAVVSPTTAGPLASVVFGSNSSIGMIAGLQRTEAGAGSAPVDGVLPTLNTIGAVLQKTVKTSIGRASGPAPVAAATIDSTDPCDFGGTLRLAGNLSDATGTGTLNATFSNCGMGAATINGSMTVRVDTADITFSFDGLTMTGPGVSSASAGSVRMQINQFGNIDLTANMVTRDSTRSTTVKLENFRIFLSPIGDPLNPTQVTQLLGGRIYHSVHGYIDVQTQVSLTSPIGPSSDQVFPISGQMTLTGSGGALLRLTAKSGTRARLQLDQDGNGVYERDVELSWTDLAGSAGTDIGDDDGDHMFNGWETAFGLNKSSAADAALDNDGDGYSNLVESVSGTRPDSAMSVPTPFDLTLGIAAFTSPATAPSQVTIRRYVNNPSATSAIGVVLTDVLPAGMTPTSIESVAGASCSSELVGSNVVVTCNIGILGAGQTWVADITFNAASAGSYSHSATVQMDNPEANPSNNAANYTVFVL